MPFGPQPDVIIVFLSGSTEWRVPLLFDTDNNIIEVVGGGGGGGGAAGVAFPVRRGGGGGGGAGYSKVDNFDPAGEASISLSIGEPGAAGPVDGDAGPGGDTIWNLNPVTASMLIASGGFGGMRGRFPSPGEGGAGGSGSEFSGGLGGSTIVPVDTGSGAGGGGGGGSANQSGSGLEGSGSDVGRTGGNPGAPVGFVWPGTGVSACADSASAGKGGDGGFSFTIAAEPGQNKGAGGGGGGNDDGIQLFAGADGSSGFIAISYRGRLPAQPAVVVVLLSGSSWPVPPNFDPDNNSIELIGAGGRGSNADGVFGGGGGGGGGGYSKFCNFDPQDSASIDYVVGSGITIWNISGSQLIASGGITATDGNGAAGGIGNIENGRDGNNGVFGPPPDAGGGGGRAGSPRTDFPLTGDFWFDTKVNLTGSVGAGGAGGSGIPATGSAGSRAGGGGGGGGLSGIGTPFGGGFGALGLIVVTYGIRGEAIKFTGHALDEDTAIQSGILQSFPSKMIDDDSLQGLLLRQLILSGRAIDEDVTTGRSRTAFTLTGDILDADVLGGRPVFSFSLVGELADDAAVSAPLSRKTAFHGQALDNDEVKAYLARIVNFRLTIAGDRDIGIAQAITLGLVELGGTILDADILSHIPVPPRDIAFFVIRDPVAIHDGPVLEEGFTNPTTLHGFGIKNLSVENMVFEIIPVNMKPDDDPTTTIFMESD